MKQDKFISHKSVMRSLKRMFNGKSKSKLKVYNEFLKTDIIKIVNKEIIKDARPEAIKLLLKATKEEVSEFLYYYHLQSSVLCLVIDSIKDRLVKEGKLKQRKNDKFGLIYKE